jgi:site-specific DNA recombinase
MTATEKAKRVVGYARVSRIGGREGDSFLSPQLQREQIEAVARREGLTVVETIEELDASGGDAKRPGWNRAIEMVERGEVAGIAVWNLARFSRSARDALNALARIEDAGGRLYSATEALDPGDPNSVMVRTILLGVAEGERLRARAGFAASTASAVQRGVHVAGTIPLGYVRGADKRLVPDPDAAPVVLGAFERRARGTSWARLAAWLGEQGHPRTESGAKAIVHNPVYLGQARYGDLTKDDAHVAIVPRALWRRCQEPGRKSARSGRLTERYLLQGVAECAWCGRAMYLSGGNRHGKDYEHYVCRRPECGERAYARAADLDAFVLNTIEERLTGLDYDGARVGKAADEATWRAATFVPRPGADDADVAEAEQALADAKADLDGFLADTTLRRVLGSDKYAATVSDYVAVANKAEADLAAAREAGSGSYDLVGRLWNTTWGWAERKEWLERMTKAVVVLKGREPLSQRVEVALR